MISRGAFAAPLGLEPRDIAYPQTAGVNAKLAKVRLPKW
jgi:hypothetical protein